MQTFSSRFGSMLVGLAALTNLSAAYADAPTWWPHPKPGLWRNTVEVQGRTMSMDQCLTEEAVNRARSTGPAPQGSSGCSAGKFEREGDKVFIARFTCREGEVKVRVTRASAESARIESDFQHQGTSRHMVMNMNYIGPCKK